MLKVVSILLAALFLTGCSGKDPSVPPGPSLQQESKALAPSDLTTQELEWLEELDKLKTNKEILAGGYEHGGRDYGVADELQVSFSKQGEWLRIEAVTEDGTGVAWDGATDTDYVVRNVAPSEQMAEYLATVQDAIVEWRSDYGDWPSVGYSMSEDEWLVKPFALDDSEAKPLSLNLPESFFNISYTSDKTGAVYMFGDRDSRETATVIINNDGNASAASVRRFEVR